MTNSRLAAMDARFRARALATGQADIAEYRASPSATPVPDCIVLVDRQVKQSDGMGGVVFIANCVRITAFRDQIPVQPPIGALFVVGGETFRVKQYEAGDESRWRILCPA